MTDQTPGALALRRLAELGITLPSAVPPVASYLPAVRDGDLLHVSGQLPFAEGSLLATGVVGRDVTEEVARRCARQCAVNVLAAAHATVGLDQVLRVVRIGGFVASDPGFVAQPAVVNGASDLLVEVLGEAGRHARSAVGVASLPLGAPVEVEAVLRLAAHEA